jgi:hypothetical protein
MQAKPVKQHHSGIIVFSQGNLSTWAGREVTQDLTSIAAINTVIGFILTIFGVLRDNNLSAYSGAVFLGAGLGLFGRIFVINKKKI